MQTIDDKNYAEIASLRAELARLKSEKEAAERERDEAQATADLYQVELRLAGEQQLSRSEEYSRQLTAATSRVEALEKERDEAEREVERLKAENAWLQLWHEEARKELELLLSRTLTKEATCPAS